MFTEFEMANSANLLVVHSEPLNCVMPLGIIMCRRFGQISQTLVGVNGYIGNSNLTIPLLAKVIFKYVVFQFPGRDATFKFKQN